MMVRDVLKTWRGDGWAARNQVGSHRRFVEPTESGKVTVGGHESDEVPPGTLRSTKELAGIPLVRW